MMDKLAFVAMLYRPEISLEFEVVDDWLEKNIQPQMIEAARNGETSLEFVVEVESISPSVIRKVLETKGYSTLCWPVVHTPEQLVKQMKVKVFW
jgi:hypothetical protein